MPKDPPSVPKNLTDPGEHSLGKKVQFWLNVAVKLTVPIAAIGAALLANAFQDRASIRMLVNQREQAETSLRATMFGQLIGPVFGQATAGQDGGMDPIRYSMLVQLTALNFAEHFELRPLLLHADQLLASSHRTHPDDAIRSARYQLRSVAHRIIDRQLATLSKDELRPCKPSGAVQPTIWIFGPSYPDDAANVLLSSASDSLLYRLGQGMQQTLDILSPDCRDQLTVSFDGPDLAAETIHLQILAGPPRSLHWTDQFEFTLSPFSFPFTDNTRLADGNRFSVFVRDVTGEAQSKDFVMRVGIRWFPKNYRPPTERPDSYHDIERALAEGSREAPQPRSK